MCERTGATAISETEFIETLEDHFLAKFNIDLGTMALESVGTFAALLAADGRVKVRLDAGED